MTKEIHYGNGGDKDPCPVFGSLCDIEFDLDETISEPVMFYYKLENFYQNHRHYIESRDWDQMKGKSSKKNLDCDGAKTNKQMGKTISVTGKPLDEDEDANPCGLIAKSYFNDTFKLF